MLHYSHDVQIIASTTMARWRMCSEASRKGMDTGVHGAICTDHAKAFWHAQSAKVCLYLNTSSILNKILRIS